MAGLSALTGPVRLTSLQLTSCWSHDVIRHASVLYLNMEQTSPEPGWIHRVFIACFTLVTYCRVFTLYIPYWTVMFHTILFQSV